MEKNLEKQKRTRQKLMNALIELCDKKGYYNISVEDICKYAGTYRSTFYRYYENKDDLLREIEKTYIQDTRNLTPSLLAYQAGDFEDMQDKHLQEFIEDMKYHYAHKQLFKFLLSPTGDPYFYRKMQESLTQIYENNLKRNGISLGKDHTYIINYFVTGYLSTIHEWLKNDDRSPEEIAVFLLKMMHSFFMYFQSSL
jgi:AcrR family transcriptional regulator